MNRRKYAWDVMDDEFQELDIWQKMSRIVLVLLFLALLAVTWTFFSPALDREQELEAQREKLLSIEQEKKELRDQLKEESRLMRDDPAYLEIIARDRLDLQRPGETIIRIDREEEE